MACASTRNHSFSTAASFSAVEGTAQPPDLAGLEQAGKGLIRLNSGDPTQSAPLSGAFDQ